MTHCRVDTTGMVRTPTYTCGKSQYEPCGGDSSPDTAQMDGWSQGHLITWTETALAGIAVAAPVSG